ARAGPHASVAQRGAAPGRPRGVPRRAPRQRERAVAVPVARLRGDLAPQGVLPGRPGCDRHARDPARTPGAAGMNATEPLVLGIETSCDETGVGIVRGSTLLANVIASSMDEHARYGGVVPEVAARAHLDALQPAMTTALQ